MTGMNWERRNKEERGHQPGFRRLPGYRDKPPSISFRKWPAGHLPIDPANLSQAKQRKARITLPHVSLLEA